NPRRADGRPETPRTLVNRSAPNRRRQRPAMPGAAVCERCRRLPASPLHERIAQPETRHAEGVLIVRPELESSIVERREADLQVEDPGTTDVEIFGELHESLAERLAWAPDRHATGLDQRTEETRGLCRPGRPPPGARGGADAPDPAPTGRRIAPAAPGTS